MTVNLEYEGLSLAEGAEPRVLPAGLFVPLPAPMPVGTRLELVVEDRRTVARVARVHEGSDSGVVLVDEAGRPLRLGAPPAAQPAPGAEHPVVELEAEADEELESVSAPAPGAPPAMEAERAGESADRSGDPEAQEAGEAGESGESAERNGDPEAARRAGGRRRRGGKKGRGT